MQTSPMDPLALAAHGPVIPVLVIERVEDAVPLAQALVAGGVRVLEVTLRTAVALRCMEAIARAVPEAIVGAEPGGTDRDADQDEADDRRDANAGKGRDHHPGGAEDHQRIVKPLPA